MAHQTNSIQASTATSFDVLVMDTLKTTNLKSILEIGVIIKTLFLVVMSDLQPIIRIK